MRTTNAGRFTTAIVVVLAELATGPAWAQTDDLTEVVVTARKRDESFQNVPMTVNVLTESMLADLERCKRLCEAVRRRAGAQSFA